MSKIQQNKQYMRLLLVKPNFITAYKLTITFKITSENFEITMKTYKLRSEVTQNFQTSEKKEKLIMIGNLITLTMIVKKCFLQTNKKVLFTNI